MTDDGAGTTVSSTGAAFVTTSLLITREEKNDV